MLAAAAPVPPGPAPPQPPGTGQAEAAAAAAAARMEAAAAPTPIPSGGPGPLLLCLVLASGKQRAPARCSPLHCPGPVSPAPARCHPLSRPCPLSVPAGTGPAAAPVPPAAPQFHAGDSPPASRCRFGAPPCLSRCYPTPFCCSPSPTQLLLFILLPPRPQSHPTPPITLLPRSHPTVCHAHPRVSPLLSQ